MIMLSLPLRFAIGSFRNPSLIHVRFYPRQSSTFALIDQRLNLTSKDVRPCTPVLLPFRFRFHSIHFPPSTASPLLNTQSSLQPSPLFDEVGYDLREGFQLAFLIQCEPLWCRYLHVCPLLPLPRTTAAASVTFRSFHCFAARASIYTSRSTPSSRMRKGGRTWSKPP